MYKNMQFHPGYVHRKIDFIFVSKSLRNNPVIKWSKKFGLPSGFWPKAERSLGNEVDKKCKTSETKRHTHANKAAQKENQRTKRNTQTTRNSAKTATTQKNTTQFEHMNK